MTTTYEQLARLAGDLAHHIESPLATVEANLGRLERLCDEMSSTNEDANLELKEVLQEVRAGLMQLGGVARQVSLLSYQLTCDAQMSSAMLGKH